MHITRVYFLRTILCLFTCGLAWSSKAQEERPLRPVSPVYALTNATVVVKPGTVLKPATVIIRDGLIASVGADVTIPPEALIIKSDSLIIYAGFIDGLSYAEVKREDNSNDKQTVPDPGNPPPDKAGITPQTDVRDHLDPNDPGIEDLRAAGFTTAQVIPYGGMLPGTASIIQLGCPLADGPFIVNRSAFATAFKPADHYYPGSLMGVMAKWRELYTQAVQTHAYQAVYASNRVGLTRPTSDLILESFYPVIEKKEPVLFKTEKVLDVQRALELINEFGLNAELANVQDGMDALEKIKDTNTPIFLSLDLPATDEETYDDKAAEIFSREEWDALAKRKQDAVEAREHEAAAFQNAGIRFGFSTSDMKVNEIRKNIRRMVAAGLSEDQALAALTTNASAILGLSDRLGTVEAGKIGNLVICDKSYFDEKSRVVDVFIDGRLYEILKSKIESATNELSGSWELITDTPDGKMRNMLTIKGAKGAYKGEVSGGEIMDPVSLDNITVDGSALRFSYTVSYEQKAVHVEVNAQLSGDSFHGELKAGDFGTFPVDGKKKPDEHQ